jgi:hypothetical protein
MGYHFWVLRKKFKEMSSFLKEPTTQQFKVSSLTICLDFFLRTAIAAQKQFFDFF